jgi:hypothetical protein
MFKSPNVESASLLLELYLRRLEDADGDPSDQPATVTTREAATPRFCAPFVRTNERTNGERGKYDERRFVTRADEGHRRRSSRALLFVSPSTANDAPLDEYCDTRVKVFV